MTAVENSDPWQDIALPHPVTDVHAELVGDDAAKITFTPGPPTWGRLKNVWYVAYASNWHNRWNPGPMTAGGGPDGIIVMNLRDGHPVTFTVEAHNEVGGVRSAPSNVVVPQGRVLATVDRLEADPIVGPVIRARRAELRADWRHAHP